MSIFYQFAGQGTMENEGSLSRCGGFVLATLELNSFPELYWVRDLESESEMAMFPFRRLV